MASHNDTGKTGENLAAIWFEEKGYTIIHKNWRHKNLEVDIVATKNNMLHFIEVKAVTTLKFVRAIRYNLLFTRFAEFKKVFPLLSRSHSAENLCSTFID